jgi:hypothetical protein
MGFFEAAVVVYLLHLQSLGEFAALAHPFESHVLLTEVLREAASLGMITSVACLATTGLVARLGIASLVFGLWDIFYYVFLRLLVGFPESLLTWDVLFLIPTPWVGPVLAPILVSIALCVGGVHAFVRHVGGQASLPSGWHWVMAVAGALIVIVSFTMDTPADFDGSDFPQRFRWEVFLAGLAIALTAYLAWAFRRPTARA